VHFVLRFLILVVVKVGLRIISITFVPMNYATFLSYLKIVKIIRFGIVYFIFPISI